MIPAAAQALAHSFPSLSNRCRQNTVHALKLCGKDLSHERLVTTLEGLHEYDTG
jgi:hypothetical protein